MRSALQALQAEIRTKGVLHVQHMDYQLTEVVLAPVSLNSRGKSLIHMAGVAISLVTSLHAQHIPQQCAKGDAHVHNTSQGKHMQGRTLL